MAAPEFTKGNLADRSLSKRRGEFIDENDSA
jgi:hypothetical protein